VKVDGEPYFFAFDEADGAVVTGLDLFREQSADSIRSTVAGTEVMGEADILWRATVLGLC
jgi:hypothetical protein